MASSKAIIFMGIFSTFYVENAAGLFLFACIANLIPGCRFLPLPFAETQTCTVQLSELRVKAN